MKLLAGGAVDRGDLQHPRYCLPENCELRQVLWQQLLEALRTDRRAQESRFGIWASFQNRVVGSRGFSVFPHFCDTRDSPLYVAGLSLRSPFCCITEVVVSTTDLLQSFLWCEMDFATTVCPPAVGAGWLNSPFRPQGFDDLLQSGAGFRNHPE